MLRERIADCLEEENWRFDRARFYAATGPEEE